MIDNTVQARAVPDDVADEIEELLGLIFQAARYERPSTDARPALEAFYRRHSTSTSAADVPEYNGWYCAQCQCGVDGSDVTFHEQHTVCGRRITNDRPPVLAAALTAPAAVEGWISVETRLPTASLQKGSFGVEVLVWPRPVGAPLTAYYGRRVTDEPSFYLYGAVLGEVTHWMPLPPAPGAAPSATAPVVEPGAQAGREAEDAEDLQDLLVMATDAARWQMLPAFLEKYQINYVALLRDIDAARATQGDRT